MRHALGNILRNIGAVLVLVAEHYDPSPPVEMKRPFTVETATGTQAGEITWHWTA